MRDRRTGSPGQQRQGFDLRPQPRTTQKPIAHASRRPVIREAIDPRQRELLQIGRIGTKHVTLDVRWEVLNLLVDPGFSLGQPVIAKMSNLDLHETVERVAIRPTRAALRRRLLSVFHIVPTAAERAVWILNIGQGRALAPKLSLNAVTPLSPALGLKSNHSAFRSHASSIMVATSRLTGCIRNA